MPETLIADIGATNSRFALAGAAGRPERIVAIENDSVSGIEEAIARYIGATGAKPRRAVLGVASPVDGEPIRMTNRDWCFRTADLAGRFGFSSVRAINDFEAIAWSLEKLEPNDLRPIGRDAPTARGNKLVLGPGTGMGVAAMLATAAGPHVIATEAGHVAFGPTSEDEEPLFARVRAASGHVSAERLLSGPGLARLHSALHRAGAPLCASAIVSRAHEGDPTCLHTVALFVRLLGRFAGDMALVFKATGGVFIAGGVAQKLGTLLDVGIFRTAFEAHPPYGVLLRAMPTRLITYEQPGLLGCAAVAATGAG
jgi:glucokinase